MVEIIHFPVRSNATETLGGNDSDSEDENATGAANDSDDEENVDDDDEGATKTVEDDDDNDEDTNDDWDVGGSRESDIPEASHRLLRGPCTRRVPALVTTVVREQNRHWAQDAVEQPAPGTT